MNKDKPKPKIEPDPVKAKRIADHKAFSEKIAKLAVDNLNRNVLAEEKKDKTA